MKKYSRHFKIQMAELENARIWFKELFDKEQKPENDVQKDILLAVTEIFVNFVKHSQLGADDQIQVVTDFEENEITIYFLEFGKSFDFTVTDEPDWSVLQESGYGIFIVKSLMDSFKYYPKSTTIQQNITKISKGFSHAKG